MPLDLVEEDRSSLVFGPLTLQKQWQSDFDSSEVMFGRTYGASSSFPHSQFQVLKSYAFQDRY